MGVSVARVGFVEWQPMKKQVVQFDSPLDALLAVTRRLSRYEIEAGMSSEDFFVRYCAGQLGDDAGYVEWANDYRHYLAVRGEVERMLHDAA
jgi:hypothetical protein